MPRLTGSADGVEYIHASAIREEDGYGDVTPAMLRGWVADGDLDPVTRTEWAAAMGRAMPAALERAGGEPARYPGPCGPESVFRWADIVRVEAARRQTRRRRGGRPRKQSPE